MCTVLVCLGHYEKIPQPSWLTLLKYILYISGGWKSKIKVSACFVSPEASLLGLTMIALCVLKGSFCCVWVFVIFVCLKFCFLWGHQWGLIRTHPKNLFYLNHLFKQPISKFTILWGFDIQRFLAVHSSVHNWPLQYAVSCREFVLASVEPLSSQFSTGRVV